jgi:DNA-binding response OmpR family regulator
MLPVVPNPSQATCRRITARRWEYDFNEEANIIESYISTLRRKVDTAEPRLIHTIRSIGYVLRVPPP